MSMVEVRKGYKMTEIGVIPEDWEVKAINDFAKVKSGKRLPKGNYVTSNKTPYPYIRVIDMQMGHIDTRDIMYVPKDVQPYISQYIISKDDIYISVAGTLGLVGKIPETLDGANLTENANRITEIECDRDYLMYYMMSPIIQNVITNERTVGAQPKLALQRIRDFDIALPTKEFEQTAIATALSDMDSLISALDKKIEKKKAIKQGLMQQLLTGKKRLLGFIDKWIDKELKTILKIQRGQTLSSSVFKRGHIPVVAGGISFAGYHNQANYEEDTITISASGANAGYVWFHSYPIFASDCSVIKEGMGYDLKFIYYNLLLRQKNIFERQTGGAQPHVHPKDIASIFIAFPPTLAEQTAIATILSDCDKEISSLETKRDKYKEMKQGMMQQLLTGNIRLI